MTNDAITRTTFPVGHVSEFWIGGGLLTFDVQLKRKSLAAGSTHGPRQQLVREIPDVLADRPVRSTHLAHSVGFPFVDEGHGSIDACGVGFDGASTAGLAVDRPRLKLVGEGSRVWPEDHTHPKAHRSPHLFCHGDRVSVRRAMSGLVRGRGSKIGAVNEDQIGATCTGKVLCCGDAAAVATQVEVVVSHWPLVRRHPQASLTKA